MTIVKSLSLVAFFALLFSACESDKSKVPAADMSSAVCIWDKASLVDQPAKGGKWLSSISLGEKLDYLDESEEDISGSKKHTYLKVKLLDGKEGWVRSDFVSIGANVAVIFNKVDIYQRPDLSTITKNSFEPRDIVAIKSTQDDWLEVTGKRKGGKWIETGWIKNKGVSFDAKDIAVGLYISRALAQNDQTLILQELNKIRDNADLGGSAFDYDLNQLLDTYEVQPAEEEVSDAANDTTKEDEQGEAH
jgi:hypothetical protein